MDAFIVIFLFIAVVILVIAVFRYFGKKTIKKVPPNPYRNHSIHLFDYQNDPNDHRNLLNPGNPIGPNWVGKNNLFRDRHNHIANTTVNDNEN
ncbi:hypothetical protein HGB07_02140 [Candidatus Roizmanbacteria bacterium]|nr:hypothetical protein [Candidatus Roizmanbacteria bacterium]